MEIELKYLLKDRNQADEILSSDAVSSIEDPGSSRTIEMEAVYYDTPSGNLTKNGIAVRVRREGDSYVATMKDKGESSGGMHRRREINVRLEEGINVDHPDISVFSESDMFPDLKRVTAGSELVPILEMRFERRELRIDTGRSISVLSCDDGEMIAGGKTRPIMELEIELYSGSEEDMEAFGRKLAEDYSLVPEDRSKFARAYDLLGN